MKKDITTDTTEMQRIPRDYYEQLCTNKLDNLKKVSKFPETCNLPRWNHKEIKKM